MAPKKKPPPPRAKKKAQIVVAPNRRFAALQSEINSLRKRISATRITTARRPQMDPVVSRYLACVLNPFSGPVSRGLTTDRALPQTNVVRRLNTFQLNLSSLPAAQVAAGVEVAIILNDARDPYAAVATSLDSTPSVRYLSRDANAATDYSIPLDSYARVISSGVKITYLGSKLKQGGMWYHFPYDRETGGLVGIQFDNTWGAVRGELSRAVSSVGVTSKPIRFHGAPEVGFAPVNVKPDTMLNTGLPDTTAACSIMRLHWIGDAEACNFNIEVAEVLEYFHVSHRHFATPGVNHPAGPAVQQALASYMQAPASGNSSPEQSGASFATKAKTVVQGAALGFLSTGLEKIGSRLMDKFMGSSTARNIGYTIEEVAPSLELALV